MNYNVRKAILICVFVELGESNAKMFDELHTGGKSKELGFPDRSEVENAKFLRAWFKRHRLRLSDFSVITEWKNLKRDENGVPLIVKRVKHKKGENRYA